MLLGQVELAAYLARSDQINMVPIRSICGLQRNYGASSREDDQLKKRGHAPASELRCVLSGPLRRLIADNSWRNCCSGMAVRFLFPHLDGRQVAFKTGAIC